MSFLSQLALTLGFSIFLRSFNLFLSIYVTRILTPSQNGARFIYMVYAEMIVNIVREVIRSVATRTNLRRPRCSPHDPPLQERKDHENSKNTPSNEKDTSFSGEAVLEVVNLSALSVPFTFFMMLTFELIYLVISIQILPSLLHSAWENTSSQPLVQNQVQGNRLHAFVVQFIIPILPEIVVWLSTLIKAATEPCVTLLQALEIMHVTVVADFISIVSSHVVIIYLVHYYGIDSPWDARMIFALGQFAYVLVQITYYGLLCSGRSLVRHCLGGSIALGDLREATLAKDASPTTPKGWWWAIVPFPWCGIAPQKMVSICFAEFNLLKSFFLGTFLRFFLSHGESFLMSNMGTVADRGTSLLITNLSSIIVRRFFQVWEGICFVRWSQDAASGRKDAAEDLLCLILRIAFYISFSFTLLASPMAALILETLYTSRWVSADAVYALKLCLCFLPLTGVLGVFESFLRATASPTMLTHLQRVIVINSIIYAIVAFVLMHCYARPIRKLGEEGKDGNDSEATGGAIFFTLAGIIATGYRLCCVLYLLTRSDGAQRVSCRKEGDAYRDSSSLSSGDVEANGHSFNTSATHEGDASEAESGAILTIATLKRASISPYLMAYLALLLAYNYLTDFSLIKNVGIGILYAAGLLYWDDTVFDIFVKIPGVSRFIGKKKECG